jgi:Trk K+ transport system NAD-binding subunit
MTRDGGPQSAGQSEPAQQIADHFIVVGSNALALRLILELTEHYEVPVMAIVQDRTEDHAPRIAQIPGLVKVVESRTVTDEALREVSASTARGIALVSGEDQDKIHAALSVQGHNPQIRVVLRMFNERLGQQIEKLLTNCASLSGSATAAPAFVNGALQRPNSVQVGERFVYVAYDDDIQSNRLCVVADRIDRQDLSRIRLMPGTASRAADFIALATRYSPDATIPSSRTPTSPDTAHAPNAADAADAADLADATTQHSNNPDGAGNGIAALQTLSNELRISIPWFARLRWRLVDTFRYFTGARLRVVTAFASAAALASFLTIWAFNHSFIWTVYTTLLDMAGAAQPDQPGAGTGGWWQRVAQVIITFCGVTCVPLATAILVDVLASGRRGQPKDPGSGTSDHIVVVGLGNIGTRVATLIHELGVPLVCVERNPESRGIATACALNIPVVVGDGPMDDLLRRARIHRSRALIAVTRDDAANLEAALEARAIQPGVRIVIRLFDDDFAHHVYATLGNVASRSVSYLSAPAFAAALMSREVLGTLSVFRHVLLIAELTATEGSGLVGMNQHDVEDLGGIRVIAVRLAHQPRTYMWNYADRARRLAIGDRIVVAATRSGLGRLNTTQPAAGGGDPVRQRTAGDPDPSGAGDGRS